MGNKMASAFSNIIGNENDKTSNNEEELQRTKDYGLLEAVTLNDTAGVQLALQNGANVNGVYFVVSLSVTNPLMKACERGNDSIVRILLDAGADPWRTRAGMSAAISGGHLSTVELLLTHDNGLLETKNRYGETPLFLAIYLGIKRIVHFLLDRGANALATTEYGWTTLMYACSHSADLEIVRRLLANGVAVEARDSLHGTALHGAASRGNIETMRELIVEHNANIFVVDKNGKTPFDSVEPSDSTSGRHAILIECYGDKLSQEHGRFALHAILWAAEFSFTAAYGFHPPQNILRIRLPMGKLTLNHFRILLSALDPDLRHNRDDSGKLPIHIACRNNAPVDILALILEQDAAALLMADNTGALPLHDSCCGAVDDSSVRFLVEQGGADTLAARNNHGALPLHLLCGSSNPSLRTVLYLIQSYTEAVAAQTNAGQYPFMIAASSTASLSVVYELVRTNPDVVTLL